MGRHVSADRRRRVAAWPIILAVVVLLLVGLTVAYVLIVNPDKKTAACTGSTVLPVTASPGSSRAVSDAATAFNATNPVARSTCVSVSVNTMPGAEAAAALAGGWKNLSTPAPALWVVDSAADVAAVDAADPALTAGHPNTSLATSPLVLAVRAAPTSTVSWAALGAGSAPLILALPDPTTNRASGYALESLVANSTTKSGKAIDSAQVSGSTALLQRLAAAAPPPPSTTNAALSQLSAGTGGFTAVPVVESEFAAYNAVNQPALTAIHPSGATAGDEMMAIPLTATWVTDAMSDAAAAFDSFLGSSKGTAILIADNLRTASTTAAGVDPLPDTTLAIRATLEAAWLGAVQSAPPSTAVSTSAGISPPAGTLPAGSGTSTATSTTPATPTRPTVPSTTPSTPPRSTVPATTTPTTPTRTTPATTTPAPTTPPPPGPAITFVLDTSGSMNTVQGSLQRIMWMQAAVNEDITQSPTALFGLWSFSTQDGSTGYTELVPLGALGDQVNGTARSAALTTAVNALTPGGNSWTYGTIRAAYTDAVNSAVAGRPNRVIVLTDGLDTTPSLPRATLLADIGALAAQNKNVVLDIVGLSSDVNAAAMTEIAQAGGGSFTSVTDLSKLQSTVVGLAG